MPGGGRVNAWGISCACTLQLAGTRTHRPAVRLRRWVPCLVRPFNASSPDGRTVAMTTINVHLCDPGLVKLRRGPKTFRGRLNLATTDLGLKAVTLLLYLQPPARLMSLSHAAGTEVYCGLWLRTGSVKYYGSCKRDWAICLKEHKPTGPQPRNLSRGPNVCWRKLSWA